MSPRAHRRWLTSVVTATIAAGLTTIPLATTAHAAHGDTTRAASSTANATGPLGVTSTDTVDTLTVENSFVSSVGWVKPGDTYPPEVTRVITGSA